LISKVKDGSHELLKPFKLSVLVVIRPTMTFQGEEGVSVFLTKSNVTTILTKVALVCGMGSMVHTYFD
jgi:hypothetical protein